MVYLGDNLGRCFSYNPLTKELNLIRQLNPEIRDVEVNKFGVLWMQTGDTGQVFLYSEIPPVLFPQINGQSVFLDGMALKDSLVFAMGDPIPGKSDFPLFLSNDEGKTWQTIEGVKAEKDEAAYAASGTTVQINKNRLYFVTGGTVSKLWIGRRLGKKWRSFNIPFKSGAGEGPYSLCIIDSRNMVAVGGNYKYPERKEGVCYISKNGGRTWKESVVPPNGYRSCVISFQGVSYACGSNGIDFSTDGGNTWTKWMEGSFLSMDVSGDEKLYITTNNHLGLLCVEPIRLAVIIKK